MIHIFFECDRLKQLFDCLYANIRKLLDDENIPMECYLIGLTRYIKQSVVYHHDNLANSIIAKVAIVQSRLVTEFSYAMLTNQTDKFRRIWNCNNYLFSIKSNDLILKYLNRFTRLYVLFNFNYMAFVHYHVIIITPVNSCILIV